MCCSNICLQNIWALSLHYYLYYIANRSKDVVQLQYIMFQYSPSYFNYKDVILINVYPQKESVYQMSIYFKKFVPISKHQDQWFRHVSILNK